jgi:DNA (cytosine-5)-methyltransferase 1
MLELSLFSGAGGGLLGSKLLGWRTVGYVEKDDYCQRVLAARIRDGFLPEAPIFGDIRAFIGEGYAECYREMVDVVTAGFPCPVNSQAARGRNVAEDLWPETATVLRKVRPKWALLENVPGIAAAGRGLGRVLGDLAALGYAARWGCLSAGAIGAPHQRARIWIVARYPDCDGKPWMPFDGKVAGVPRLEWPSFPDDMGMGDGVAHWMDRLAALGNGQVPAVVRTAWSALVAP